MLFRNVIFDFDGTLANSLPVFLRIMNRIAVESGFRTIDDKELEQLRDLKTHQFLSAVGIPLWRLPFVVRQMRQAIATESDQIPLFPGVEQLLQKLSSSSCRLAIVSSNSQENIQRILGPELLGLFSNVQAEASLFGKRTKLRRVLRQLNCSAAEAIYVGDEMRDMEAAHSLNMAFAAVTWGHTRRAQLESGQPRYICDHIEELAVSLLNRPLPEES